MRFTRTRKIVTRASDAEYQALHAIARCQRRKVSEALRELIREKAKELRLWPSEEEDAGDPAYWSDS